MACFKEDISISEKQICLWCTPGRKKDFTEWSDDVYTVYDVSEVSSRFSYVLWCPQRMDKFWTPSLPPIQQTTLITSTASNWSIFSCKKLMCTAQIIAITVLENKRLWQIAVNSRWLRSVYTGRRTPRELETATLQRLSRSDVVELGLRSEHWGNCSATNRTGNSTLWQLKKPVPSNSNIDDDDEDVDVDIHIYETEK